MKNRGRIAVDLLEIDSLIGQATPEARARQSTTLFSEADPTIADNAAPPRREARSILGDEIFPYRVLAKIGDGVSAEVFLAESGSGQRCAIKALRPELARDPSLRRRFQQEATAIAKVTHPNVVTILEYRESAEGRPCLLLEYAEGKTIQQTVEQEGALGLTRALNIGAQIASALDTIHAHGLIHRDLKASNVMICQRDGVEEAKILDFGLVRTAQLEDITQLTRMTRTGQMLGSPAYMAPEQIYGTGVGPKTDSYALGVLVHYMVTGRFPFNGTIPEVLDQHRRADLDLTTTPISPLLAGLLEKRPEQRWSAEKAERFFLTPPLTATTKPRRPAARSIIMLLCALCLLALAVSMPIRRPEQTSSAQEQPYVPSRPASSPVVETRKTSSAPAVLNRPRGARRRVSGKVGSADRAKAPRTDLFQASEL